MSPHIIPGPRTAEVFDLIYDRKPEPSQPGREAASLTPHSVRVERLREHYTRLLSGSSWRPRGLRYVPTRPNPGNARPVLCVETGDVYPSLTIAGEAVGRTGNAIRQAVLNGYSCGGYRWSYAPTPTGGR